MIDFDSLESSKDELRDKFRAAEPFRLLVIDDFCDRQAIRALAAEIPSPDSTTMNLSRDYVFAWTMGKKARWSRSSIAA